MIYIKRRSGNRKSFIMLSFLLSVVVAISGILYVRMHKVIITYALSEAETLALNAANKAVLNILKDYDISYDDIVMLSRDNSGYVTSLEINIAQINRLKSSISNEISNVISKSERYKLHIPLGTFFGSEYTSGMGPDITFKFQITTSSFVDFEHEFTDAGINQVLHKIIININVKGNILLIGSIKGFSVSTTAIAAQTVIVGIVPNAFTEVVEGNSSDMSGIINDYGAN